MEDPNTNNNNQQQQGNQDNSKDEVQKTSPEEKDTTQTTPEPKLEDKSDKKGKKEGKDIVALKEATIQKLTERLEAMEATLEEGSKESKAHKAKIQELKTESQLKEALPNLNPKIKSLVFKDAKSQLEFGDDGEISNLENIVKNINENYKEFIISQEKPAGDIGANMGNNSNNNPGVKISQDRAEEIKNSGNMDLILKHQDDLKHYNI
ncbi:MAG: hypothetical protein ACRCTS_03565 [Fusobacteriaceae bacterium]